MRRTQSITVLGLTVLIGVMVAACGGSNPPAGAAQGSQGPAAQAYAFAHCMQSHGVSSFPDPVVSTNGGETSIKQVAPPSVVQSPAFRGAQKACARLQPGAGNGGGENHNGPGKAVLLALARCIRTHGFTSFPDPNSQGKLTSEMLKAAGIDPHTPGFFGVARGCLGVTHGAITVAQIAAAINHFH